MDWICQPKAGDFAAEHNTIFVIVLHSWPCGSTVRLEETLLFCFIVWFFPVLDLSHCHFRFLENVLSSAFSRLLISFVLENRNLKRLIVR